ncbi:MAG: type II toxin-antitoxin system HipA family toxin [Woeseiaceae bacterium]|nr:type II toxin-antitoxin system HipA family toxin [Woeseiaceae bacterium]
MGDTARVLLWGSDIGAVTWLDDRAIGVFQYTPEFAHSGIEVAPIVMPLRTAPYEFPTLTKDTFNGLPGMLADSLPDKFGNALINAWLAGQGRTPDSFTPVERLCYTGTRGVGALEYRPAIRGAPTAAREIEISALVELANRVLDDRIALEGKLTGDNDKEAIEDILRVGTSAGGARAKAVLAWNEATGKFRSGQAPVEKGFTHWLMKFDGVSDNKDRELADPKGYGRIEYAYHLMAEKAGIKMNDCRLHEEGGRAHFLTKRFDRLDDGNKLHMQSLGAMMHYDFNQAGAYSYEQAIQAIKRLGLSMENVEQQFVRAAFNVIARNQDDHVKNIAFLMDRRGRWRLSPAFDVVYSYNPSGEWTDRHQMSLNGKRDGFDNDDLLSFAKMGGIKKKRAGQLLEKITTAVVKWQIFGAAGGVPDADVRRIESTFRKHLFVQS